MRRGNRPPPIETLQLLPAPSDMLLVGSRHSLEDVEHLLGVWIQSYHPITRLAVSLHVRRAADLARELSSALLQSSWQARHGTHPDRQLDQAQLRNALLRLHQGRILSTGVLRFINTAVQFLPALFLGPLLRAVQQGDFAGGRNAATALFAVLCLKTLVENQFFHQTTVMATRVRAMLQASIYEKSLRLHESVAAVPPVTLMQVDTGKVEELTYSLHTLWDGIFQVVGYSVLLWWYLGLAGFAGIVILIVFMPFNASLQRQLSGLNKSCLQATDARVSKTAEILNGIRALRQMGWEDVFERIIRLLRDSELQAQRKRDTVGAYLLSYFSALPPFMIAVVLLAYVAGQRASFNAAMIFTALSLLNQIRFPLLFYPSALNALAEGQAALRRIAGFLSLEEAAAPRPPMSEDAQLPLLLVPGSYHIGKDHKAGHEGHDAPTLVVSEHLSVAHGELVGVLGPVGSGKSTLLRAFLGELPGTPLLAPPQNVAAASELKGGSSECFQVTQTRCRLHLVAKAYCSQQPWIPEGRTLLEVVAGVWMDNTAPFPPQVNYDAFSRAISAAAVDFAEAHDEVSATSLSGGQQARLALARAMYKAQVRDVCACVLDDVTAALDPQVTLQVINNCLNGPLQDMATLLVASDPGPWLQRCDRIIVMKSSVAGPDSDASELQVDFAGSYEELTESGRLEVSSFSAPMQADAESAEADEEETEEEAVAEPEDLKQIEKVQAQSPDVSKSKQITAKEARASGAVPLKLYAHYFRSARSPMLLGLAGAAVMASYAATAAQQWWIGLWTADASMKRGLAYYMLGVIFWGLLASGLTFGRSLLIAAFSRRASRAVHDELCEKVLVRASTSHFDQNPSSRLLQNFSKDLEQIDNSLPNSLRSAVSSVTTLAGAAVTIVLATPRFTVILLPLLWLYTRSLQYYRPVARELKRLEPLARSPVYAEQAAAASGVITIRKLGLGNVMAVRSLAVLKCSRHADARSWMRCI